jgi:multicomponent K+:H+ antiporter subunit D
VNHLILVPILLPALTAVLILFAARADRMLHRTGSLLSLLGTAAVSGILAWQALEGPRQVYTLGAWPVPHGIVLVLDPLGATMLVLVSALAVGALLFAAQGWDLRGRNFHPLFQLQLMGLNGAFLTGDIFNLFVFFEILLIASYGLLLHGGGEGRLKVGLHYVVLNLVGSVLFILGLALVYGGAGTLNMADLAVQATTASPLGQGVLTAAALLLLVVFALKAAAVPLHFWLPGAYASATAPVACLFAIMTKVGLYAILRVHGLVFGLDAALPGPVVAQLMLYGGGVTLAVGAVGALASRNLRDLLAWLMISSVGTTLVALSHGDLAAWSAALYYLVHSTLAAGAMFLLAEVIAEQRGRLEDALRPGPALAQPALLGGLFLIGAATLAGLPPTSGFLGKVAILQAALDTPFSAAFVFAVVLGGSLLTLVTLARAGSALFWNLDARAGGGEVDPDEPFLEADPADLWPRPNPAGWGELTPIALLLGLTVAMSAGGGPLFATLERVAAATLDQDGYVRDVLAAAPELHEGRLHGGGHGDDHGGHGGKDGHGDDHGGHGGKDGHGDDHGGHGGMDGHDDAHGGGHP